MMPLVRSVVVVLLALQFTSFAHASDSAPPKTATVDDVTAARDEALKAADISWLMVSSGLVLVMLPGLALFYGGMVRRKNILGTMMHTMVALGLVGVQWVAFGYSLSFGESQGGVIGYSKELLLLSPEAAAGTTPEELIKQKPGLTESAAKSEADLRNRFKTFPNTKLPLYLHALFQGMFAIITVALISGAFAERVRFGPYLLFCLIWTTVVYDPLAHWVWAFEWVKSDPAAEALGASGWLGKMGALDFAGGTVVHIAAGVSGLAAVLVLRKRSGYGQQSFHPNSIVLTLFGAGLLWFGWFGFNGGSALASSAQAVSAMTVTQIAAAAAGMAWLFVEWAHRGKPTALGFASGIVAGLVAITPASGFVAPGGALLIGALSGAICYGTVACKARLGYDDSLDAFGIHGVGGILGALLTGALVSLPLWVAGTGLKAEAFPGKLDSAKTAVDLSAQISVQAIAVVAAAAYSFVVTFVLALVIEKTIGFTLPKAAEQDGLDRSCHGEVGFDYGGGAALEELAQTSKEPKAAATPPNGPNRRFTVAVDGIDPQKLLTVWSKLCQSGETPPSPQLSKVYPFVTTVSGNRFRFRGGDPAELRQALKKLFEESVPGTAVNTHVEA